jgi:hypothetical protein
MQTREEYISYLKEAIEYYKTDEYQQQARLYKEETATIKDIYKMQEIWKKYLDPNKNRIGELFKKYQTNKMQVVETGMKFDKEPDVSALVLEMAKYAVK